MKQIIIVLLSVIVLILGYNLYSDYQRFHSPGTDYVSNQKIDLNYHDQTIVQNYHQAIEDVNGFVRLSWANNDVDVRNPDDDDDDTKALVNEYTKKLGIVKMYEKRLIESAKMKSEGLNDKDVIAFETSGFKGKEYDEFVKRKFLMDTFKSNPEKYSLKVGDYSSFVYELQKILVKKGHNIPIDGLFRDITFKAVGEFEQKNGLFPDGKVDAVTLDYLIR
ncbi:peptidoglycan-binding domain-containing protein [Flavobacterium sp.]|uniref:peptidoglycan-binding domain-containing protein n=1 Tax=Flavobacterium sp. TaxID=239 RepID=UPI002632D8E9|nr:peptidoglycan-binding domain-containing protein [Flavobacterium sp.]